MRSAYRRSLYVNGCVDDTRLSAQWTVQVGINRSNDTAVWNHNARPTLQACARWVSANNNDMFYPCINSLNGDNYNYDNVHISVATWRHRFSQCFHMLTEA